MKVSKTSLSGVLLIEPDVFPDPRGYFYEAYNQQKYREYGIDADFVQDNISRSCKGTVRGLHYQAGQNAQGKLCQVLSGRVLDVAVDIRFGSPTFGEYVAVELSGENKHQLWIPPGFAHGFSVLSPEALFMYKCTAFYSKTDERAIKFDDPDLAIDWMVESPLVSDKDLIAGSFRQIGHDFSI